ncbi:MAG TPA: D-2-hydroxyacid dehydrogenase [Spirochaetia bacterium]|nr:D-2-hydroxyacid dehydrogenase [Spirochaetia bacterium]
MQNRADVTNVLIVYPDEAERMAGLVRDRFPDRVSDGSLRIFPVSHNTQVPQDMVEEFDIVLAFELVLETPRMKRLKWLQTLSSGIDHWEKSGLLAREIPLVHVPGGSAIPIGEFVMGLLLNHVKRYDKIWENQKHQRYERFMGGELSGRTLAVVGLGGIGREVARLAKCFSMHVIGTEMVPSVPNVDEVYPPDRVDEVIARGDFVLLAVPETPQTKGMMDERRFRLMKKTAYFLNCARGSLVVKEALIKALDEEWIAGASIDTFWIKDPLPSYLPPTDELWTAKNVYLSPHISSWTDMYTPRFGAVFLDNLDRYFRGQPLVSVAPGFGAGSPLTQVETARKAAV